MDLIPTLGQPKVIEIMYQMIKDEIVTPSEAALMFNLIALTVKPTQETCTMLLVRVIYPSFYTLNRNDKPLNKSVNY